jgi:hypothetical protein
MRDFYSRLPVLDMFADLMDLRSYTPAPPDWCLVVADLQGSTEAIKAGRYKDVNIIAASTLIALKNALDGMDVPFVFGGDGVTLLIPPEVRPTVEATLVGVQEHVRLTYKLVLRAGVVRVSDVLAQGAHVLVARYLLAGDMTQAMFAGGGLSLAEHMVKADPDRYAVGGDARAPDFTGFSCRWKPIKSTQGKVLAVIVEPVRRVDGVYDQVLTHLHEVFGGDLSTANPVRYQALSYKPLWQVAWEERHFHPSLLDKGYLIRLAQIFLAGPLFGLKVPPVQNYIRQTPLHADFRKVGDRLYMVLDCTLEQARQLNAFLEMLRQQRRLCYGLHVTDHALMTCHVNGLGIGQHIHFVDADKGGYAMAAAVLKAQIKDMGY